MIFSADEDNNSQDLSQAIASIFQEKGANHEITQWKIDSSDRCGHVSTTSEDQETDEPTAIDLSLHSHPSIDLDMPFQDLMFLNEETNGREMSFYYLLGTRYKGHEAPGGIDAFSSSAWACPQIFAYLKYATEIDQNPHGAFINEEKSMCFSFSAELPHQDHYFEGAISLAREEILPNALAPTSFICHFCEQPRSMNIFEASEKKSKAGHV